jgi:hypothetical protein
VSRLCRRSAAALVLAACAEPTLLESRPVAPPVELVVPRTEITHRLDPAALLSRVSLDLRGVRPTVAELDLIEADPEQLDTFVDAWLLDPRFGERLADLFDDVWSTRTGNYYPHFDVLEAEMGLTNDELVGHFAEEPLRMLSWIAEHDLPYDTFVTADWSMADEVLGAVNPVDYPPGVVGWRQVHYTDGRPAVGVLATNDLWWLHGSMANNLNRNRANTVARALLGSARASLSGSDRKFLFVRADGGWDTTKVFAPVWSATVHHEPAEEPAHVGSIRYVSHPDRPSVDQFYARHGHRLATLDGILVRSVNHPVCRSLWMTSSPSGLRADWPSLLGAEVASRYVVPQFIVSGYQLSADLSAFTAFSGKGTSLDDLLTGRSTQRSDPPSLPSPAAVEALADRTLAERIAARAAAAPAGVERRLLEAHLEAATRLGRFKSSTGGLDLSVSEDFDGQVDLAVHLLENDLARCVQLQFSGTLRWDTHADNDRLQGDLFEGLFQGLERLVSTLERTPGTVAPTLLDEVTVVVFSEMGRTPYLNHTGGKEHWMYTSALLLGSGIRGGAQAGGYDTSLDGLAVDPESGAPDQAGEQITTDVLGSTLLTLADIDPVRELGVDRTMFGVLS